MPEYLTVREVAKLVRRHQRSVYRWLDEGFIAGKKLRGGWLIPRDEIDRILNQTETQENHMTSADKSD